RTLPRHISPGGGGAWRGGNPDRKRNLFRKVVCSSYFLFARRFDSPHLPIHGLAIMAEAAKPPAEGEEAEEYESDPEDSLGAMRRREASDEEREGERSDEDGAAAQEDRRIGSVGGSDGEGGAPGYDDEEEEEDNEYEEEEEDYEYEEDVEGDEEGLPEEDVGVVAYDGGEGGGGVGRSDAPADGAESGGDGRGVGGEKGGSGEKDQPEGKESEPFAVPTAGAFYMHDDRFRENVGGRHNRRGGRRLWESKDEQKWVHDRFDEMNLRDAHNEERTFKRSVRGRGRSHIPNRGSMRGGRYGRSHAYDDGYRSYKKNTSHTYDDSGVQNRTRKSVRGRGRQYEPLPKNNKQPETQNKQLGKSHEVKSNTTIQRQSPSTANAKAEEAYPQKHVFTSSLNSASPPFYPSGSSNPDVPSTLRRDSRTVNNSQNISHSVSEDKPLPSRTSVTSRGTAIHDPLRQQSRLYINDFRLVAEKSLANLRLPSSGSLAPINTIHSTDFKGQDRGFTMGKAGYQPTSSVSQLGRGSGSQAQLPAVQQPAQTSVQPLLRVSAEQSGQRPSSGSQVSFPSQAPNSSEVVDVESPSESGKSKLPVVLRGKTSIQESGRGSLMYSGGGGAMGLAHGDQSFPATPALLPVMQFGAQHPGGLGVPAVGMALPGYVAQTQLGFGNSEMTWVPVLAGAAGGLAASYGPYIALDGSYCARPPGQTSSAVASRETSTSKTANVRKTPQRPEVVDNEYGQRQNKPRRQVKHLDCFVLLVPVSLLYSEMNFGHYRNLLLMLHSNLKNTMLQKCRWHAPLQAVLPSTVGRRVHEIAVL
ncbi:hypothetical protein Taro_022071, partial [Colocasia esculenta]|nr:hypothetical protein [Colocasia esculenta]